MPQGVQVLSHLTPSSRAKAKRTHVILKWRGLVHVGATTMCIAVVNGPCMVGVCVVIACGMPGLCGYATRWGWMWVWAWAWVLMYARVHACARHVRVCMHTRRAARAWMSLLRRRHRPYLGYLGSHAGKGRGGSQRMPPFGIYGSAFPFHVLPVQTKIDLREHAPQCVCAAPPSAVRGRQRSVGRRCRAACCCDGRQHPRSAVRLLRGRRRACKAAAASGTADGIFLGTSKLR